MMNAVPPLSIAAVTLAQLPLLTDTSSTIQLVAVVGSLLVVAAAGAATFKARTAEVWRQEAEGQRQQNEQMRSLLHEKDIQIAKLEARPTVDGLAVAMTAGFKTNSVEHLKMIGVLEEIAVSSASSAVSSAKGVESE